MQIIKHPTLYTRDQKNNLRIWKIRVEGDTLYMDHGQVGKKITTSKRRCVPKNQGRANATTAEEQAVREAQAEWDFQVKRKYALTPEEAKFDELNNTEPMKAQSYKDLTLTAKKKLKWPMLIQPKLDGIRCLARWGAHDVELISKVGLPYISPTLVEALRELLPKGAIIDGEIYCPGMPLPEINSLVKRPYDIEIVSRRKHKVLRPDYHRLSFYAFDLPALPAQDGNPTIRPKTAAVDRNEALSRLFVGWTDPRIRLVPTSEVETEAMALAYEAQMIKEGFEGAMLRVMNAPYRFRHKSRDVLKLKTADDDEFLVIGAKEGQGSMEGKVIWTCVTEAGVEFDAAMATSMEERERMFQEQDKFIGKKLTVLFNGYSPYGAPIFPRGKAFRLPEDL